MLNEFITKLENLLNQYDISNQEKQEIISDYKQMIEDGKEKDLPDEKIIEMLGNPEKIVRELGLRKQELVVVQKGEKLIALSPFISLIIFMILGLTKNLWHPGWMVFLLIPITAIIVELGKSKDSYLMTALSPFIAGAIFFIIGFIFGIWHPTWLIFLIIPMFGIINTKDEMDRLTLYTALSPFISFIIFMLIGYYTGQYQYAWLVLLLVVILGIFHEDNIKDKLLLLTSLTLSIVLYIILGLHYTDWIVASSAFIIFIITGIWTDNIRMNIAGTEDRFDKLIVIISILLFLGIGYFLNLWAISWLLLLIIPVAMIIKYNKDHHTLTALSPFISLSAFMLLGYFYNLWHIAWIAFIFVPMIAIIEDRN